MIRKSILTLSLLVISSLLAIGQKCELGIGFEPITDGEKVDASISRSLETKLKSALTANGVASGDYDSQFIVTGKFDHEFTQQASGPGGKVFVKTTLLLAILDVENRKIFSTASFDLKGTGSTDTQALKRALSSINTQDPRLISFIDQGREKILSFFNSNYHVYLNKAQQALKNRDYNEALYFATQIPECCTGYEKAVAFINTVMVDRTNYEGASMLAKAEAAWGANPTDAGAAEAYSYLSQIDPSSSSYKAAKALSDKMTKSVKADYDFETKEKYRHEVELEKSRIQSAKEIAVAYAKNRPKTVVINRWRWW